MNRLFQSYYKTAQLDIPTMLQNREWGFNVFNEPYMNRHKAFQSLHILEEYVKAIVPKHIFYSVAFYNYPLAKEMNDKDWQGSELVFDIDSGPNAKTDTIQIIDILENAFGIKDVGIVFSGNKGYHIHVIDSMLIGLDKGSRQEIVQYIKDRGGEFDEQVTRDIKRLIRCPGSLHGKTGLRVSYIDRDKLDEFDPQWDAVVFSDELVEIVPSIDLSVMLRGEVFSLTKGERIRVPEYVAVLDSLK
jgi:DNA primase catalytic subunit